MSSAEQDSPEYRYTEMKLDAATAQIRAAHKQYGGRISLITGGVFFASGAFVSECLLGMAGQTEHMSAREQALAAAAGGLAAAALVIRRSYKSTGMHPLELIQSRRERQRGNKISADADYLRTWLKDPEETQTVDESIIEEFQREMDREL